MSGAETLFNPVDGPDDMVYVNHAGTPSVMGLDGTGLQKVPDGRPRPASLGGKMVADRLGAVSNPDGSLAVEYLGSTRGYRVGTIEEGKSSGIGFSGVVINAGEEVLMPLAWVGEDQFLTSARGVLFLNQITMPDGDGKPLSPPRP